ncbi:SP_1767 family glycosyltransferase, partial [bacterium]|nr:SP_1767 family glycosyltransferase [bacterium]
CLIPLFKRQNKNKDRVFYNIFGIKIALRKNKFTKNELLKINLPYENKEKNLTYPKVLDKYETLKELINSSKSIARYGDGEFNLIWGESLPFQKYNNVLAQRLKEILKSQDENCLVALPDVFASLDVYNNDAKNFWRKFVVNSRSKIYEVIDLNKQYFDTETTRPYMDLEDKTKVGDYFKEFKKIWQDKDVIFVEGEKSRLGFKNDLFDNAKSIKRILCPSKDAYFSYEKILKECEKQPKNSLFIIALGPTVTVLAYDLTKLNYRALDLGHIDIEYEWFLLGADKKVPIKNKYVNECKNGKNPDNVQDIEYQNQIIARIGDV